MLHVISPATGLITLAWVKIISSSQVKCLGLGEMLKFSITYVCTYVDLNKIHVDLNKIYADLNKIYVDLNINKLSSAW